MSPSRVTYSSKTWQPAFVGLADFGEDVFQRGSAARRHHLQRDICPRKECIGQRSSFKSWHHLIVPGCCLNRAKSRRLTPLAPAHSLIFASSTSSASGAKVFHIQKRQRVVSCRGGCTTTWRRVQRAQHRQRVRHLRQPWQSYVRKCDGLAC